MAYDLPADRSAIEAQPEQRTKSARILKQGPWNEQDDPLPTTGPTALPMPVEIATEESLEPFFAHLERDGTHVSSSSTDMVGIIGVEPNTAVELIEFPRGVLYSDARLDLCKMVVGPTHIETLMNKLRKNNFVKHFLLGNNIIGLVGAEAIARFVTDLPERIETWYLAGNCINKTGLDLLVQSWIKSPLITNIWLKRNPLSSCAPILAKLICECPSLRTLDLDLTELGDAGVGHLFSILSKKRFALPLRHLYLNATGISEYACQQISDFLQAPACALESLYMSCNPIGDAVRHLAPGLKANHTLQRLMLSSCGLKSASLLPVLEAACRHPSLRVLDLGQAYATEDLGARYNWLTDDCIPILRLLVETTQLQYLDLGDTIITPGAAIELVDAASQSTSLLFFQLRFLGLSTKRHAIQQSLKHCQTRLEANVKAQYDCSYEDFMLQHRRYIISSRDVRLIDSVYRNRDAGLARRHLKVLDKHWQDGDDTAQRAELGLL